MILYKTSVKLGSIQFLRYNTHIMHVRPSHHQKTNPHKKKLSVPWVAGNLVSLPKNDKGEWPLSCKLSFSSPDEPEEELSSSRWTVFLDFGFILMLMLEVHRLSLTDAFWATVFLFPLTPLDEGWGSSVPDGDFLTVFVDVPFHVSNWFLFGEVVSSVAFQRVVLFAASSS